MASQNCTNAILLLSALLTAPVSFQVHAANQEVSHKVQQEQVNINNATAKEISIRLKGVGPKKAAAIVKYREKNGEFSEVEELLKVQGITKEIVEKNRNLIVL